MRLKHVYTNKMHRPYASWLKAGLRLSGFQERVTEKRVLVPLALPRARRHTPLRDRRVALALTLGSAVVAER